MTEKLSHGSPTWFVQKTCVTWMDDHHGDGNTGWLGVRLVTADDAEPDWVEIAELVEDAYRTVAPARLVRRVDAMP